MENKEKKKIIKALAYLEKRGLHIPLDDRFGRVRIDIEEMYGRRYSQEDSDNCILVVKGLREGVIEDNREFRDKNNKRDKTTIQIPKLDGGNKLLRDAKEILLPRKKPNS